jgi:predicted DCC family thiol-disulfide oxidoreductase YuxK
LQRTYLLAYDADCGPCARFRSIVELLDSEGAIEFVPLREADSSGRLDSIDQAARYRSFHLVSSDGSAWSGAEALAPLSTVLHPGGRLVSRVISGLPAARRAVSFGYSTLARLHEKGSCGAAR